MSTVECQLAELRIVIDEQSMVTLKHKWGQEGESPVQRESLEGVTKHAPFVMQTWVNRLNRSSPQSWPSSLPPNGGPDTSRVAIGTVQTKAQTKARAMEVDHG